MSHQPGEIRLDAVESAFFKRELEAIDTRVYEVKYPAYKARSLLPTIEGVSDADKVYTYRMFDTFGTAKFIGQMSDDLPRAEAKGDEFSRIIKPIGASYGYNIFDIKAAAKAGTPLDPLKALGCRRAVEELLDSILSLGSTTYALPGLLSLSSTTSFTPSTKALGGLTWGTLGAPNATGLEVAYDMMGITSKLVEVTKGVFTRFRIVLPIEQFNYAQAVRIGDGSDVTALEFAKTSPFIESVEPWFRCDGAGSGATDRMCAYPYDPEVIGALVPMEFTLHPPERRNLEYVINATSSTGGVVCRYPLAVAYGDGI